MSVGPAALGNVLVQRLDAVLGTTMSAASANQVSGARPDAVSQPGSLEKPGQADGSPRDPRQGVQSRGARGERAAIVDAKTAAALAWPRAAWSPTTTPRLPRPPRWAAPPARFSRCWRSTRRSPRPCKGARATVDPDASAGRQPGATAGQPAAGQPAPGGQPPAPHANTPAGQPQAAAANSAANVATVLNAIAGDPATAAGKTPGQTGATEGAPPPRTRPPPPAPRWPRRVPPARWARPCAKPCRPAACSTNHTWPIWPSAAPTHPSCAKNRRPTSSRPTPSSSNTAPPPRAHAPKRPPAVAPAADAPASGGSNAPAPGTPINGIHQDLNALVRQQLDVLANQALAWRGEAWPGTPMDWEVQRDPYGGDPESAVPTWATRLKLDLPRLGLVDARLNLAGDQIVLQLVAPHSAALIDESSDQLRSRLLAAGLTLSHMTVNVVDPRPIIPTDF